MKPYTVVNSKEVFKGRAVRLVVDKITLPNDETTLRETVHNHNAAAILPIDDNGDVYLVRQYRHALGREILEIPAGIIDDCEPPEICAHRELEEEIGLKAGNMTHLLDYHGSVGICSGKTHVFVAKDLTPGTVSLDYDEFITVEKYSLSDCLNMIKSGKIIDGKTILAIYAYKSLSG